MELVLSPITTPSSDAGQPDPDLTVVGDLRAAILAGVNAGESLEQIEQTLIDPATIDADVKSALWLLAWSAQEQRGSRCRN